MSRTNNLIARSTFRAGATELEDLPWGQPVESWHGNCSQLADLPRGVGRHPLTFINCTGKLYAIKEMPTGAAFSEYELLEQIAELRLPVVTPVGAIQLSQETGEVSYLVTEYLKRALPYRILFMSPTLQETRQHLLDAMASLLVQLHLAGIFWGDCSLSNTLFRHDAGALQAYMVDAESAEIHSPHLFPPFRFEDLKLMQRNLDAEMLELASAGFVVDSATIYTTGASIRHRYHLLWDEITRVETIHPAESYRINERIRTLNQLGYSIREVELKPTSSGDRLHLKIIVADRSFHKDQLLDLTGVEAEERQARILVNEIQELRATQSKERNETIPIEAAAVHWQKIIFQPVLDRLAPLVKKRRTWRQTGRSSLVSDPIELYCQVLEHKWYLSERAQQDVGHWTAVDDYISNFSGDLHNPEP